MSGRKKEGKDPVDPRLAEIAVNIFEPVTSSSEGGVELLGEVLKT